MSFAIIAMPRTASTSALYWIQRARGISTSFPCEIFAKLSNDDVDATLSELLAQDPIPDIKLVTHHKYAITRIFDSPYNTIVILPSDVKQSVLKTCIEVITDTWFGSIHERSRKRAPFAGTLTISPQQIQKFAIEYSELLTYAMTSDFYFADSLIVTDPNARFLHKLGLPSVSPKYFHGTQYPGVLDDRSMLANPKQFDRDWDEYFQ